MKQRYILQNYPSAGVLSSSSLGEDGAGIVKIDARPRGVFNAIRVSHMFNDVGDAVRPGDVPLCVLHTDLCARDGSMVQGVTPGWHCLKDVPQEEQTHKG